MEKFLTQIRLSPRVSIVQNGLKLYLEQIVGENPNKTELAERCDVPYHIVVDIFRGKSQRPDPHILENLAAGLERPYDELALAAYGRLVPRKDLITDPAVPA